MKKYLLPAIFLFAFLEGKSQLIVSSAGSPSAIASFLTGYGVTISNCVLTGDTASFGYFSANNTNLNMAAGFMMSSGHTFDAIGPNNSGGAGTDNGFPGDSDLTNLAGCNTYNAAVLEFDCVPINDTLYFNYVFGSDEYPEYVSAGFNDVFAIFISGPSISFQNMAWLPNTTTPVSVTNVNANTNSAYYINDSGDVYLQMDGQTTNLKASIPVIPGSTYHFKIGIADALDGIIDSDVFFQGGSFRCANPNAVSNVSDNSGIKVFPVPAENNLNLSFENLVDPTIQIVVHSLSGQEILSQKIQASAGGTATVDISSFAEGMYTLEIIADGKRTIRLLPVTTKK